MDSHTSRKIIVASGMAVAIGIGVAIFALRSHSVTTVAQTPRSPAPVTQVPAASPEAAAQIPEIPAAVGQTPDAPATVAQIPDAPAAAAHNDVVDTTRAETAPASGAEPKLARNRHLAKTHTNAVGTNDTGTRVASAVDAGEKPGAETVANGVEGVKSADELTPPPATSSPRADDQGVRTGTEVGASDSQITTDVKSELAGDSLLSKDVYIGVTTLDGVVVLTGSLASQDAIDHVKDVAGKVKDVKSVDGSALVLASR